MRELRALRGDILILGARIPRAVLLLAGLTFAATVSSVIAQQAGLPVVQLLALEPERVWQGQLWRLVTWAFLEFGLAPLGLVFACLVLVSIGGPLTYRLGPTRFVLLYLAVAALSAGLTCLVGLLWPSVMSFAYTGAWPSITALFVGWAVLVPNGRIFLSLILPVRGRQVVYGSIAIAILYGIFYGFQVVVPELFAILIGMIYFRDPALYRLWLRIRLLTLVRRSRPSHLRAVDKKDDRPRWLH